MSQGPRKVHDFCWINLITPDLDRSMAFFEKLFGWTYKDDGIPNGRVILVDGLGAGAIIDVKQMPPGTPPVIGVMIKVQNADETVAKASALGGRGEAAFDVMKNGRMGMCIDPNGGIFAVWQPIEKPGFEVDGRAHGAPTWFETITDDVPRAVKFYGELFGWTAEEQSPVPGMKYTLLKLDGVPIAGAMGKTPHMPANVPAHWGTTFAVKNADETVRLAKELGAEICIPVQELPNVGRFALLKSPQGVSFHLMQYA
jgi:predicted enzyme related to lactoylglutathione lyase